MSSPSPHQDSPKAMFGFSIVVAPNGTLHVLRPYAQHFSREDPGRFWRDRYPDWTPPAGRGGYCLDPRTGRMLYGY